MSAFGEVRRRWRSPVTLYLALAALSGALYLGWSAAGGVLGFPLDDAWIHQTYARNLGWRGEFAFLPGQLSGGSTAPLWSGLLAVGHAIGLEPRAWAYLLGLLALALTGWLAYRLALALWPERPAAALVAGVVVALEWHLAWAAVSGMETLMFTALALAVFVWPPARPAGLGVLAGVALLARPDALLLLPVALARVSLAGPRLAWRPWAAVLAGFLAVGAPYLAFNFAVAGSWWPNTFYAKQAEYAVMQTLPLSWRLATVGSQPWLGAQVLAAPGAALAAWEAWRRRSWAGLLPLAWAGLLIAAYVVRLPVTYQYGRYVMPVIPVLVVMGVGGLAGALRLGGAAGWPRLLSRAWAAAAGLLLVIFWVWGAVLYRRDVRIIETEMVATARWIAAHTPSGARIAAHDVGALGYFGGRPVLDLAGLVAPDVIPFIRNEARLRAWLDAAGADYLMTFPGWYPDLVAPLADSLVYQSAAGDSPAAGGENMAVYQWR